LKSNLGVKEKVENAAKNFAFRSKGNNWMETEGKKFSKKGGVGKPEVCNGQILHHRGGGERRAVGVVTSHETHWKEVRWQRGALLEVRIKKVREKASLITANSGNRKGEPFPDLKMAEE